MSPIIVVTTVVILGETSRGFWSVTNAFFPSGYWLNACVLLDESFHTVDIHGFGMNGMLYINKCLLKLQKYLGIIENFLKGLYEQ